MKRALRSLCALPLAFGLSMAAHAATMDLFTFQLTGVPGTGTATIVASPTPSSYVLGSSFTLAGVPASYGGSTYTGAVTFFDAGGAGSAGTIFTGDKLYTGLDSSPTFRLGTFNLNGNVDLGLGVEPVVGQVTITQLPSAATPEPETLVLVGTASLVLAAILRRRFA